MRGAFLVVCCVALCVGCSDPETERIRKTTVASYDTATGKLKEVTFDANKNGTIDTWTEMNGAKPLGSRMDQNEDGKIDRWEYYDGNAKLVRVGFSRANTGKPDAWAFSSADGQTARVEISSTGDEKKIDRWERYVAGVLTEADEDTDGDGRPDKWETFAHGAIKTVAFDQNRDGRPDRRLTYEGRDLVLVESEPDAAGKYTRRASLK